jgi:hypothetical protein
VAANEYRAAPGSAVPLTSKALRESATTAESLTRRFGGVHCESMNSMPLSAVARSCLGFHAIALSVLPSCGALSWNIFARCAIRVVIDQSAYRMGFVHCARIQVLPMEFTYADFLFTQNHQGRDNVQRGMHISLKCQPLRALEVRLSLRYW